MYPNSFDVVALPDRPSLEQYKKRAKDLVKACRSGAPDAIRAWAAHWSKHVDQIAPFAHETLKSRDCALTGAQFVIARIHGFDSWPRFASHLDALERRASSISHFEAAVDAIVAGDAATLQRLLREHPELAHETSTRKHHATLLHYTGANGVENYRQKTPPNIVAIAAMLLDAGADVNAEADIYGGSDTLGLAATSVWPELAGVQNALMQLLLDRGAALDGPGTHSIVRACLANGRLAAAKYLADHGGRVDLEGAAGIGRLDLVAGFFDQDGRLASAATEAQLRAGFMHACDYGQTAVVEFLLEHGVAAAATRQPDGKTGLHGAAIGAHDDVARLLIERGADVNALETTHGGRPLSWALYGWSERKPGARDGCYDVVARLVRAGAAVNPAWLDDVGEHREFAKRLRADPRMLAALQG
jgi:hypothetical protein